VIALYGELGAGKTSLVKGIAQGLEIQEHVTSPTFTLIQEYQGKLPMYHFDCYRLNSIEEFSQLGPDEYFFGKGVCLIEWAEKIEPLLPPNRISIRIDYIDPVRLPTDRKITWQDRFEKPDTTKA
jgi:tRNA threonylcarbamoyladenosine biosynthesis protein TsaE